MTEPIVRQIDHVYVPLEDAPTGFAFLTESLGLPVAWPYSDYGFFGSGGVCLANVNLEALNANEFPTGRLQHPARISGIAFEPSAGIDELLAALDGRGISHTPPIPYGPSTDNPLWTNVGFDVTEGTFVCKYHFDVPARRKQLNDELAANGGGALGIVAMEELVIAAREIETAVERWRRLLNPIDPSAERVWTIGHGPSVRLVPGDADRVEHVVLRVRSVADARTGAESLGLSVGEADGGISLAPDELGGLAVVLRD